MTDMIVLTRIDDRLIHGQVVEGWVNFLKANSILVADDNVASNPLQRSILEIAVPQGLRVHIGGVEDICTQIRSHAFDSERAILLFSRPADVLRAIRSGLECRSLNIGGMRYTKGKQKLMDVLAVDESDMKALSEIMGLGIKVDVQTVPTGRPLPLGKALAECKF